MRKKIYKVIAIVSITLICNLGFFNVALAEDTVNIKKINQNVCEKTYEYNLNIPEVTGMKNSKFQNSLNKKIKDELEKNKECIISTSIDDFKYANENNYDIKKYKFKSDYNVTSKGNILSLTIKSQEYIGGEYSLETQKTYNIDLKNNRLLELKDVVSDKNIKRIEEEVNKSIQNNSKYYKREVKKNIENETNFYVDESNVYVYFNANEIGPYTIGIPEFKFSF
ncbi:DUF3298 and DUF4163 domain-containing protein [Clostridium ihumii]|uniref:DUF3298 and DUF4163 domain-containing protein n=1 Tax=Clostridium ihumii TaxID=1470356 RepID=UPI00058DEAE7|nr:DUF3298 and DUF4163 domain-containing protein [Clostridium ihumii]